MVVLDILDWLCRHSQARAVQWHGGQTAYFRCRGWGWKTRERLEILAVWGTGRRRTGVGEGFVRRRSCVIGMWGNWVGKLIRCVTSASTSLHRGRQGEVGSVELMAGGDRKCLVMILRSVGDFSTTMMVIFRVWCWSGMVVSDLTCVLVRRGTKCC